MEQHRIASLRAQDGITLEVIPELKDVPEEQRASMLAALSKEVSDLCRTGAFEFISELHPPTTSLLRVREKLTRVTGVYSGAGAPG